MSANPSSLPKIGLLYLDHVLQFFHTSNFKGWPDKIEVVTYHWGNDKARFIREVKRKKIEVLIGNIPATAYEKFREIARELPHVRFIPSLDTQFANKSKENVTRFCMKHKLPIPATKIFYEKFEALDFLSKTSFPKIIKKSYGPSNYGGYFVHKVDSYQEAVELLNKKRYYPVYVQDFVPMKADIRVMLIGHKPVCAFWRRPPEGEWLTNTSQGGSMNYNDVPMKALDIAVKASKAAKAEYWACDIALGNDGKFRILECATAFAAFPYIRDWIGQYLMWLLSDGCFKKPTIPMFNWEELSKIDSSLLRIMRHIVFGSPLPSYGCEDVGDAFASAPKDQFAILPVELRAEEEWPSEVWNFQDNYQPRQIQPRMTDLQLQHEQAGLEDVEVQPEHSIDDARVEAFLVSLKGVGPTLVKCMIDTLGHAGIVDALVNDPARLQTVDRVGPKKAAFMAQQWQNQ